MSVNHELVQSKLYIHLKRVQYNIYTYIRILLLLIIVIIIIVIIIIIIYIYVYSPRIQSSLELCLPTEACRLGSPSCRKHQVIWLPMVTLLGAFWRYYWNNLVYIYINYMIYIYICLIYHSASMILLLIRFVWFFIHFSGSQAKNNQAPGSAGQGSWERACEEAVESWPRAQTMRFSISPDFTGYHCHSSTKKCTLW